MSLDMRHYQNILKWGPLNGENVGDINNACLVTKFIHTEHKIVNFGTEVIFNGQ